MWGLAGGGGGGGERERKKEGEIEREKERKRQSIRAKEKQEKIKKNGVKFIISPRAGPQEGVTPVAPPHVHKK